MPSQSNDNNSKNNKSTSVFHALGSYADRIKEQSNGKSMSTTATTSGATSPAASGSTSPSRNPSSSKPATTQPESAAMEDDGPWETVRTGRNRSRQPVERAVVPDEKRGSNSRNWRERDEKPDSKKDAAAVDEDRSSRPAKKDSSTTSTTTKLEQTTATTTPSKPVWGNATPAVTPPSAATSTTPVETPLSSRAPAPTSSEEVKAGAPKVVEVTEAAAPAQEAEAAPASAEDDSWRAQPKEDATAEPSTRARVPAPAPVAKVAAPPAVNAWDMRKKQMAPAAKASVPSAPVLQFGSVNAKAAAGSAESTSDVKVSKKAKKKAAAAHEAHPAPATDTSLWPDISQAAVGTGKTEEKKSKNEAKDTEVVAPGADDQPGVSGKKQKWMAIPAAELQEAADKAAESSRRQATKAKQRAAKDDNGEGGKGRGKKGANAESAKKGTRAARSGSQGSESPAVQAHNDGRGANGNANGSNFRFGTISADPNDTERVNGDANGSLSAPLSRQPSSQSKRSPAGTSQPLSPDQGAREFDGARGAPASPQQPFGHGANLPRPPRRDRDGRGGYPGRGRGGYRSSSNVAMNQRMYAELSPLGSNAELAGLYQRGYGLGYNVYPIPPAGYAVAGFDPAQYPGMTAAFPRGIPPPPQPVTQVANLDALRYYVLGQVEYYFSMQNLAMDFFLRQQMDSEGWIEVPMIASFNRIKSLTPDVAIVREVMELSSLLDVKDDMVRLASGESKRWVLPDAKPCKFGASGKAPSPSPKKGAGESAEISHGIPLSAVDGTASALGIEDMVPAIPGPKFDVEIALMRNAGGGSGSANVSSTASVFNSDDGKTMTPETSIAGDTNTTKSEGDAEEAKQ